MDKNNLKEDARNLLKFDGLAAAEQLSGVSYKESLVTQAVGFGLMIANNREKEKVLKELNDTHFGMTFVDFISLIESNGFVKAYEEEFPNPHTEEEIVMEKLVVYWKDGILLEATSHWNSLNGGHILFNWEPNPDLEKYTALNGCSNGPIIIGKTEPKPFYNKWTNKWEDRIENIYSNARDGSYDVREGLFLKISDLQEQGKFLNPWIEPPFLYFVNYNENKVPGYDYKKITYKKILGFPLHVIEGMFGSVEKLHAYYDKEINS
jgi:hypothetical protein